MVKLVYTRHLKCRFRKEVRVQVPSLVRKVLLGNSRTFFWAYNTKARAYADTALQFAPPGSHGDLSVRWFRAHKTNALTGTVTTVRATMTLPAYGYLVLK